MIVDLFAHAMEIRKNDEAYYNTDLTIKMEGEKPIVKDMKADVIKATMSTLKPRAALAVCRKLALIFLKLWGSALLSFP